MFGAENHPTSHKKKVVAAEWDLDGTIQIGDPFLGELVFFSVNQ